VPDFAPDIYDKRRCQIGVFPLDSGGDPTWHGFITVYPDLQFATETLLLMPELSRWRPGNAPMLPVQVYENKTAWPRWHQSFGKMTAEMLSEGKGIKVRKTCAYNAYRAWGTWSWKCTTWGFFPTLI
jgi:hypothetical protein